MSRLRYLIFKRLHFAWNDLAHRIAPNPLSQATDQDDRLAWRINDWLAARWVDDWVYRKGGYRDTDHRA